MAGSGRDPPADWATREPLPQWQHLDDGSEDDRRYMGSKVSHLSAVGLGWATIVGGSIAHSILDPSKRHLLLSHRLIHARLTAQWATVGALMLAGIGEHFASRGSMLPSMPRPGGTHEQEAPPAPAAQKKPRGEDWTRL